MINQRTNGFYFISIGADINFVVSLQAAAAKFRQCVAMVAFGVGC